MHSKHPKLVVMCLWSYPLPTIFMSVPHCQRPGERRMAGSVCPAVWWCSAHSSTYRHAGRWKLCVLCGSVTLPKCRVRPQIIHNSVSNTGPMMFPVQCLAWDFLYSAECSALSHTGHLSASSSGSGRQFLSPMHMAGIQYAYDTSLIISFSLAVVQQAGKRAKEI